MTTVEQVKSKVQRFLTDELGRIEIDRDGDFVVHHESSVVFVRVAARNDKPDADIVIRAFANMVSDVNMTPEVYKWVATEGQDFILGSCAALVDDDGRSGIIQFRDAIVGNDLDPNELFSLVFSVLFTSNSLDDEIVKMFGGKLFLDT